MKKTNFSNINMFLINIIKMCGTHLIAMWVLGYKRQ